MVNWPSYEPGPVERSLEMVSCTVWLALTIEGIEISRKAVERCVQLVRRSAIVLNNLMLAEIER